MGTCAQPCRRPGARREVRLPDQAWRSALRQSALSRPGARAPLGRPSAWFLLRLIVAGLGCTAGDQPTGPAEDFGMGDLGTTGGLAQHYGKTWTHIDNHCAGMRLPAKFLLWFSGQHCPATSAGWQPVMYRGAIKTEADLAASNIRARERCPIPMCSRCRDLGASYRACGNNDVLSWLLAGAGAASNDPAWRDS